MYYTLHYVDCFIEYAIFGSGSMYFMIRNDFCIESIPFDIAKSIEQGSAIQNRQLR